ARSRRLRLAGVHGLMQQSRIRPRARTIGFAVGLPALTLGALVGIRAIAGPASAGRPVASVPTPPVAIRPAHAVGAAHCRAHRATIGTVVSSHVVARTAPSPTAPAIAVFDRTNREGSRQVFLLERHPGSWYRSLLPVR